MKKIFDIIQGLFSLDEEKSSIVVYIMIAVAAVGLNKAYVTGDFAPNMMALLEFLIASVMAYNVTNNITTRVSDAKIKKTELEMGTNTTPTPISSEPIPQAIIPVVQEVPIVSETPSIPAQPAEVFTTVESTISNDEILFPEVPSDFKK